MESSAIIVATIRAHMGTQSNIVLDDKYMVMNGVVPMIHPDAAKVNVYVKLVLRGFDSYVDTFVRMNIRIEMKDYNGFRLMDCVAVVRRLRPQDEVGAEMLRNSFIEFRAALIGLFDKLYEYLVGDSGKYIAEHQKDKIYKYAVGFNKWSADNYYKSMELLQLKIRRRRMDAVDGDDEGTCGACVVNDDGVDGEYIGNPVDVDLSIN
jgi:hypothetical protein